MTSETPAIPVLGPGQDARSQSGHKAPHSEFLVGNEYRRISSVLFLTGTFWVLAWLGAHWLLVSAPLDRADAIVVLSGHSRRAIWTFLTLWGRETQFGLDPVPTGIQTPPPATWWLHARGWQLVFIEYLKLVNYRFRGLREL